MSDRDDPWRDWRRDDDEMRKEQQQAHEGSTSSDPWARVSSVDNAELVRRVEKLERENAENVERYSIEHGLHSFFQSHGGDI